VSATKKAAKGGAALLLLDVGVKLALLAGAAVAATKAIKALTQARDGKKK